MDSSTRNWLICELERWADTFDNEDDGEPTINAVLPKLREEFPLTKWDYDEILFHLFQKIGQPEDVDERAAVKAADHAIENIRKDEFLGLARDLFEEYYRKRRIKPSTA